MTWRAAWLLLLLSGGVLLAPLLAPYDPARSYREFLLAPPMRPRFLYEGALHSPFIHPITLVDRLEQRYEVAVNETRPLPWFDRERESRPAFLLGADSFGRDVLSRLLFGARLSIGLALLSTIGAVVAGACLGMWAGYRGGLPDELTMRIADFLLVLPAIYVLLVLRAALPLVMPAAAVFAMMAAIFVLIA